MEHRLTTEAQQLLDAAFAGKLDMDADAPTAAAAATADEGNAGQPAESTATTNKDEAPAAQDKEQPAPIASKSGAYTIPYEKLTEARSERDHFKAEATEARSERDHFKAEATEWKAKAEQLTAAQANNLAAATAQAQARADAGQAPTQADANLAVAQAAAEQGIDISVFGDFSEEGIAKGVATLVEQRAAALVDAKLKEALAPLQRERAQSQADAHYSAIYAAHKDADEIVESDEFKKWMAAQPTFARSGIEHALKEGGANQVIEVFSMFKAANGKGVKPSAAAAAAQVADQPPTSLSELPGAAATGAGDVERASALAGNPAALLDFMADMAPAKRDRLMNSVV